LLVGFKDRSELSVWIFFLEWGTWAIVTVGDTAILVAPKTTAGLYMGAHLRADDPGMIESE
jgi:hypothetical protein